MNPNETFLRDLKRRFVKSFLDLLVLKLIQTQPMWGYKILKETEALYQIKLRHGALYPLLNTLETKGFIKSTKELKKGRIRKVYEITPKGINFVKTYQNFLRQQLQKTKTKTKEKNP
jgi:DNA-binding PadR family transcriptional regulator